MDGVTFIAYQPSATTSLRERALLDARARSHAARVSYRSSTMDTLHKKNSKCKAAPMAAWTGAAVSSSCAINVFSMEELLRSAPPLALEAQTTSLPSCNTSYDTPAVEDHFRRIHNPSSGSHDPFAVFLVQADNTFVDLLIYFQTIYSRVAVQIAPGTRDRCPVASRSMRQLAHDCMQDRLSMCAFKAAGSARRQMSYNESTQPAYHAVEAIKILRERIGCAPAIIPEFFLPILLLATYEAYSSNWTVARSQLQALKFLGGLESLDHYTRPFCEDLDVYCAVCSLSKPIFEVETTEYIFFFSDQSSGQGFCSEAEMLGNRLVHVARCVIDCARAAKLCRQYVLQGEALGSPVIKAMEQYWGLPRRLLAELPGSALQEAFVIALSWWLQALSFGVSQPSIKHQSEDDARELLNHWAPMLRDSRATKLVERLQECNEQSELNIWIAATGMTFSPDEEVFRYFAFTTVTLLEELRLVDVRKCLSQFLWLECLRLVHFLIGDVLDRMDFYLVSVLGRNDLQDLMQPGKEERFEDLLDDIVDIWKARGVAETSRQSRRAFDAGDTVA